jgi:hypothetical protein
VGAKLSTGHGEGLKAAGTFERGRFQIRTPGERIPFLSRLTDYMGIGLNLFFVNNRTEWGVKGG